MDCILSDDKKMEADLTYTLARGVELNVNVVDLGNCDADVHVKVVLNEGSRCSVNLASLCHAGRRKVFSIDTYHQEGDSYSRTKMAGINLGDGTLFFYGTSDVPNGSHGSDTRQEGKITNLSPGSRSEVSPALLIKDNDVNASHGAALGAYDPEALYYMMSRGLSKEESQKLITIGSLIPIVQSISDKTVAEEAMASLEALSI